MYKKGYMISLKKILLNKILQIALCGSTLVATVSFTSKLGFYIHNSGNNKKMAKKVQRTNIFKNLGIGSLQLKPFCCFVFISFDFFNFFKFYCG